MDDWPAAVSAADRQGVLPLLDRWVSGSRPPNVPAGIAIAIRQRAQVEAIQSLTLAGEMLELARRLERAGIPVIALKGPALAVHAYGAIGLRPQMDVDLLVRARDVDRAAVSLENAGYARVKSLAPGQEAAFREIEYHHSFAGPAGTSVELHWGIIKRQFGLSVREDLWWSGTQRVSLGGGEVTTLGNELTLAYLAIHGAKHEWPHVRWIGDIAAVARLMPMDWDRVRAVSASLGTLRMTRLALAVATDVVGAELPEPAARLAREDTAVPALVREVRARVETGELAGFVGSTRFQLAVRERWRDRLAFAVRHAVTPNVDDLGTAELPAGWRGAYWILRPLRLARRWAALAVRRGA